MSKLTVKEYATKHQISTQAVYSKIAKGLLDATQEGNKTFVYDNTKEVQPNVKDDCNKLVKQLLKQNKKLIKRIDKLEKKIDKEQDKSSSLLLAYVDEMKSLYLPKQKSKKHKK
jgi:cell division septum initiation protein DivIVA